MYHKRAEYKTDESPPHGYVSWLNIYILLLHQDNQGRKCGGVWGGGSPPQRNDPVGLKLRAVGLKIMRLFTCSALRSKLNIFETRVRLRLLSWKFAQTAQK